MGKKLIYLLHKSKTTFLVSAIGLFMYNRKRNPNNFLLLVSIQECWQICRPKWDATRLSAGK